MSEKEKEKDIAYNRTIISDAMYREFKLTGEIKENTINERMRELEAKTFKNPDSDTQYNQQLGRAKRISESQESIYKSILLRTPYNLRYIKTAHYLLGCSLEELENHCIKFTNEGMTMIEGLASVLFAGIPKSEDIEFKPKSKHNFIDTYNKSVESASISELELEIIQDEDCNLIDPQLNWIVRFGVWVNKKIK